MFYKNNTWLGLVVHTYNPNTEAGRLQVQGQPGLHSMTLSQKQKRKKRKKNLHIDIYNSFTCNYQNLEVSK
jgi:hypothetical protein